MARVNVRAKSTAVTHEGASAQTVSPVLELRRTLMTCMLWEDSFYESGSSQAARIAELVRIVDPADVADLAIEARTKMYLRHAPLYVCRELARRKGAGREVYRALTQVIRRADEMPELLTMFWGGGDKRKSKDNVPSAVKRALADVFPRFDAYQLAKYNRDNPVKLKDVFRLAHPKAESLAQYTTWKQLCRRELAAPDTWEVELSAGGGKGKKESWTRLLAEGKLGGLALLRNLRNMVTAGVDLDAIRGALATNEFKYVLPFRFVAAARYAPSLEPEIERAMFRAAESLPMLTGSTGLLIDVSGSMDASLSAKSDMNRIDAAAALAMLLRERAESVQVATFSQNVIGLPARRGFALRDVIHNSQPHSSTYLKEALVSLQKQSHWANLDRLIVITDEQSADGIRASWAKKSAYVINVAGYQHGLSYGNGWTHIDGFSERVLDFIRMAESSELFQQ